SAVVFLLDEQQGELNAHLESMIGVSDESVEKFSTLYTDDPQYRYTVTGSQREFMTGHLSTDRRLVGFYRPMVDVSDMESALVVPLVIRERSVGEIMLASREADFFNSYDLQVVLTVAGQLATVIEEFSVTEQTDESLRARVEQLTSLARVTRELNVSQDLSHLLRIVYEEGLRLSKADCGTITLFEFDSETQSLETAMVLGCARGEDLTEIELAVIQSGEPALVEDAEAEGQHASHEGVRSALVAPIAHRGKTVGLFHLHSMLPDHFDENILDVVQTLAVQAAIAFGNAYRFQEQSHQGELLRRRANTLSSFLDTTGQFDIGQSLEAALEKLARGIRAATPFDTVLMSVYEPETGLLRRVTGIGIPETTLQELKDRKQPLVSIQQLLKDEFKIGGAHYIPADQMPIVPADVHMVTLDENERVDGQDSWAANDFLLFLLQDKDGNPLGLISLDQPRDGRRPDLAAIETIEIFAAQTALVISTQTKVRDLQEQVTALSAGIERQQRLLHISQNDLPILLHKDLEQMITVQNLDRRARRIRAGLQITESVSRQLDSASALQALGREILTHLGMSTALVAEETVEGPRLIHVMGNVPRATNPEALFGQRNPLRSCLQSGKAQLVMNLDDDDEWRDTALLTALHTKSFFSLPIKVEGKVVAAVLAVNQEPMLDLSEDDQQVYFQIARQSSVILQNIELLTSARRRLQEVRLLLDFSSRLSGLGPSNIVEALLESALRVIPAAHAGILLLWDERRELLVPQVAQHYADSESMLGITYKSGEALPGKTFADRTARHVDEVDFARDYTLSAAHLLRYRQATGGRLPISSLLIPVQTGDRCLGVLVLDNFNKTNAFHTEDETLLLSLAQQVALSLENLRLVDATAERAGQLQALNDVAATMTASLQSGELIDSLLEQFSIVIPFDTATLWLHEGDQLRVAAARGFADSEDRLDLTVAVSDSMLFAEMIRTGEGVAIPDVRHDARFPSLVEAEHLSWMGIPLISKGDMIGTIALEKTEANFYNLTHLQVATTFASQAAVALENARLYADSLGRAAELDERSQRLALLNRFSSELSGSLKADQVLWMTADELLRALDASQVSVVTLERGQVILKDVLPDAKRMTQGDLPQPLPETPLFGRLRESLGMFTTDDVQSEAE
ncbi:MAG: GAF domain-containing protein, partial [Anaerolineales bacterium]|nr:GAF domain-containing protein [Anaerolineales bacterium]